MSTNVSWSKNKPFDFIHIAVVFVLMFLFKLLPPFGGLTETGMGVMGVFLGIVYGWTFCSMLWPSMLCVIALGFTGFTTVGGSIVSFMGHSNVLMVFSMLLLISMFDSADITKFLAFKVLNLKIGRGRPWLLTFLIIYGTMILTATAGLYAAIFIMYDVFYKLAEAYGIKKTDKYGAYMVAGITFACIMAGGQAWPWAAPVVAFMGAYQNVSGIDYTGFYAQYIIYMWIMHFIFALFWTLGGKFIVRPDVSAIAKVNQNLVEEQDKLDGYQKFMVGVFVVMLLGFLLPSFLPKTWGWVAILANLGITGVALIILVVLFALNFIRGYDLKTALMKGVNFDVLFLIAAVMGISAGMSDPTTGISVFLNNLLSPVLAGHGKIVFLILVTLLPAWITGFCNNTVIGMLFIPIAYNLSITIGGINHFALAIMLCNLCSIAMLTGAGCPLTAIMLGQKDWIDPKRGFLYGILGIFSVWIPSFISIPFASMLFPC